MDGKVVEWKRLETKYGQRVLASVELNGQLLEIWGSASLADKAPGDTVKISFDSTKNKWKFAEPDTGHSGHSDGNGRKKFEEALAIYSEFRKLPELAEADPLAVLQLAVLLVK